MTTRSTLNLRADSRGQLLLLTAIVVGVVIIGTVVLLNGIRFMEHTGIDETLRAAQDTDWTVEDAQENLQTVAVASAYEKRASTADFKQNISAFERTYQDLSSHRSSSYVSFTLKPSSSAAGAVLRQDTGVYENENGDPRWSLVEDAKDVPYVRFEVTDQSMTPGSDFTIVLEGRSKSVELRFTETNVQLVDGSGSPTSLCSGSTKDETVTVTIVEGAGHISTTADDVTCRSFSLGLESENAVGNGATVSIDNGDEASGSFLVTMVPWSSLSSGRYDFDPDFEPETAVTHPSSVPYYWTDGDSGATGDQPVYVKPVVRLQYDSPAIQYTTSIDVMGENFDT